MDLIERRMDINHAEALEWAKICLQNDYDSFEDSLLIVALESNLITPTRELGNVLASCYTDFKKDPTDQQHFILSSAMSIYMDCRCLDKVGQY